MQNFHKIYVNFYIKKRKKQKKPKFYENSFTATKNLTKKFTHKSKTKYKIYQI